MGVFSRQTFRLRRSRKFLVRGEQYWSWQVMGEKRPLQKKRTSQVDGVVATQLLAASQCNSLDNDVLIYIYQPVLTLPVTLHIPQ